jgi:hypothetical protein
MMAITNMDAVANGVMDDESKMPEKSSSVASSAMRVPSATATTGST